MTKSELIKELEEFPDDMKIEFMVSSEELVEDSTHTHHAIESIEVCEWIISGLLDLIYTDYDDFIQSLLDAGDFETIEDAEKANPIQSFEKRIVIYTGAA